MKFSTTMPKKGVSRATPSVSSVNPCSKHRGSSRREEKAQRARSDIRHWHRGDGQGGRLLPGGRCHCHRSQHGTPSRLPRSQENQGSNRRQVWSSIQIFSSTHFSRKNKLKILLAAALVKWIIMTCLRIDLTWGRRQGSGPYRIRSIARKCCWLRVCRCIHRRILFQRKRRLEKRALSSENRRNVQSNAAFVLWMNYLLSKFLKRAQNIPTYSAVFFHPWWQLKHTLDETWNSRYDVYYWPFC